MGKFRLMSSRVYRLDFLRAFAITIVFIAHTVLSYGPSYLLKPLQTGGIGVDLFFVLSGWLIGSQLFKEIDKTGSIDVRRFLIRRWMRTVPAYYAVLALTFLQFYLTKENFSPPINYIFFLQNYDAPLPFLGISWSLCVEEQFYLLIAPLLFILGNKRTSFVLCFLSFMLIAPTVFRLAGLYDSYVETHVSWDCCIMGVLLAFVKARTPSAWNSLVNANKYLLPIFTILLITVVISKYTADYYMSTPSKLVLALTFATWVVWANNPTTNNGKTPNKLLMSVASYIALRSYSIYLLHPEALSITTKIAEGFHYSIFFITACVITLLISEVLYRTVEVTFINAREKFSISRSKARAV